MRSGLSESEAGHATWEDVSKDTFVRFAQFAYTGDYSIPVSVIPEPEPEPADVPKACEDAKDPAYDFTIDAIDEPEPVVEDVVWDEGGGWHGFGVVKKNANKKSKKKSLRVMEGFPSTPPPLSASRNNYEATCEPCSSFEPWVDYSALFISHASLWILGDYRNIGTLKALALYKLHRTLSAFQLNSGNVPAIIDLVRNAYSEEGAGLGEGISGLRKMVCQYLGLNKALLCDDDGFMDLLGEGGQFVKDFFKYSSA